MTVIQVVKFEQAGYTLYSGVMTISQLMDHAVTTEWDPGLGWTLEGQGYQRVHEEKHWRRIGDFLRKETDPLLPNNALLASRDTDYGTLQFNPIAGDMGYLEIHETRQLFVVDYQHRWKGFWHAINNLGVQSLQNVKIPVTILANAPVKEETKQFYLINNKQKRVNTDLALTLMNAMSSEADEEELDNLVGPGNRYRIRATRLVVKIAQLQSGPWVGKIEEPNGLPDPNRIATIKSFVDSLRPIVGARSPVYGLTDDELVKIILAVWEGVLGLWPEWGNDFREYAVQRAMGLFVFHRVARALLIPEMLRTNDQTAQLVTATLSGAGPSHWLTREFWRSGGNVGTFSSGAGQAQLAEHIVSDARRQRSTP